MGVGGYYLQRLLFLIQIYVDLPLEPRSRSGNPEATLQSQGQMGDGCYLGFVAPDGDRLKQRKEEMTGCTSPFHPQT